MANKTYKASIFRVLAPSVMCMLICIVCLCTVSWAWFTDTHASGMITINTATYTIDTQVNQISASAVDTEYIFNVGENYTVTIVPTGEASSGYCKVMLNGAEYFTPQIGKGTSFTFLVTANEMVTMRIVPQWGSFSGTVNLIENQNITIGISTENITDPNNDNTVLQPVFEMPTEPEETIPQVESEEKVPQVETETNNSELTDSTTE